MTGLLIAVVLGGGWCWFARRYDPKPEKPAPEEPEEPELVAARAEVEELLTLELVPDEAPPIVHVDTQLH